MARFYFLVVLIASVAYSSALTVGRFENLTTGIWDAWNDASPDNVKQGRFGMQCANGNLWLVSRRLYRKKFESPWDPASRGGIVSTLDVGNGTQVWSHKPYTRLDDDQYGDKLFTLNGRLFMLTYATPKQQDHLSLVSFHKLFFWDDQNGRWLETPFDVDPAASTLTPNHIVGLSVTVPRQLGNVAYVVASSHAYAQRGSEMVFSALTVDFRGTVPVKATLKPVAREQSQEPSAVVFTAIKDNLLFAFIHNFYSEGYVSIHDFAYVVDLKTKRVGNITLAGASPPMDFDGERMFQTKDEVLMAGGRQMYGLGQMRDVRDIWSLNLNTLQWRGTNAMIPEGAGDTVAYDQQTGRLYLAGLKEGVSVAQLTV